MLIDRNRELDFLDGNDFLAFASSSLALFLLVQKAAVVLDTTDGRNGARRDFNEVEAALASDLQRLKGCKNAKLFAVFVDNADFARANPVVDADKGLSRTFIECDGTPPSRR